MSSKSLFFPAAFLTCFLLYLPALQGGPIWDDLAFWFHDPELQRSYWSIWTDFSWPLSVSVQKAMLSAFGERYVLYHLTNLALHFINAALVYRVAVSVGFPRARWVFLLFLFHPANVISVAWMIQLKTLICFLFAILAFAAFQRGLKDRRWLAVALFYFLIAMLAKASAVMLPFIFLAYTLPKERKKWFWQLPFLIVAGVFAYQYRINPYMQQISPNGLEKRWEEVGQVEKTTAPDFIMVAQTLRHYLWQSIAPIENYPIKGRAEAKLHWMDILNIVLLLGFFAVFWRTRSAAYLLGGIVMLVPFLGFVYAPFMSMTWVSDQHLYLALPMLLMFWVSRIEKLPRRAVDTVLVLLLGFFAWKSAETAGYFKDEDRFYSASMASDPGNVTVALNFATTLAYQDRTDQALSIAQAIHDRAEKFPVVRLAPQFVELEKLRLQLIDFREYKKTKTKN
jgi:hypothetical protein